MKWIYEKNVSWAPGRLLCVHAGLSNSGDAEKQIRGLLARDLGCMNLYKQDECGHRDLGRFNAFSSRSIHKDGKLNGVMAIPDELTGEAVIVSGHHGFRQIDGDRMILDDSGGVVADGSIEAIILPERILIGHDGGVEYRVGREESSRLC